MAKQGSATKKQPAKAKVDVAQLKKENEALKAELAALRAKKPKKQRNYSLWRPITAGVLAVFAIVAIALFNVSYWVRETIVDTDQFVTTLQPLIKDPDIQKTLQTEITDEVFAQINLEQELKNALPENLAFIAGPFAGQVKSFTYGKIGDVLNSDQAYQVWTKALTTGHSQIIAYVEDPNNSGIITVNSVYELAGNELKTSDVGFLFGKTLPSSVGEIQLADIEGVPKARQALNALQEVTVGLAIASVVFTALAIAVSTRRRNMIIGIAVFTLIFMLSTLAALQIGASQISSNVQPAYAAAAEATYSIITAPLATQTQGVAALIGAALIVAIVSSSWKSVVWLRTKMRSGLDWSLRKIVGTWQGASWIDWICLNRVVICWTLVAVSFVAFALRLPPTVNGVRVALIASLIAAAVLEIIASISRVTKK